MSFLRRMPHLDCSSLLSHWAVSNRVNTCIACSANFSAIKNWWKQAFGDEAMSRTKPMSGTNILKRAKLQLSSMNIHGNHQHKKTKKTSKQLESDSFKLSFDHSWSIWRSWNFKSHVSSDSHWKFRHTSCSSQICATPADWRSETCVDVNKELVNHANADKNYLKTSFSSPSSNPYWKDDNLSLSRKLKKIHHQRYAIFQKTHSRNASKTGRNTGSDV